MPDATDDILIHAEAGVLTLTFNRVAKKNSLTWAMYDRLTEALRAASADPQVRTVLLQGDATVFTAGSAIEGLDTPLPEGQEAPAIAFLRTLAAFDKPVVAAVCGPAVGIGTTMLLHCDLVYAGDNAAFALPFVNLGLCPEGAASLLLPQMLGHHRAAEALLLGEPIQAEAALEVGLVNRVVPPTEANAVAQAQARKLAAKPLSALLATKALMKRGQAAQVAERLGEEAAIFRRMRAEPAAKEAFAAFLEKRRPDFSRI
jgi:enoyl-CoA hydratase/carnithine racemase